MTAFKAVQDFLYSVQKTKDNKEASFQSLTDRKNVLNLKIVCGIDISGSISAAQYSQFLRQLNAIRGLSIIKVIETDTKVCSMYTYNRTDRNQIIRLNGGGGTEFSEAFMAIEKIQPDAILFMTDGAVQGNVSDPGIPVGWVLTRCGKKPYNFGKEILKLP